MWCDIMWCAEVRGQLVEGVLSNYHICSKDQSQTKAAGFDSNSFTC